YVRVRQNAAGIVADEWNVRLQRGIGLDGKGDDRCRRQRGGTDQHPAGDELALRRRVCRRQVGIEEGSVGGQEAYAADGAERTLCPARSAAANPGAKRYRGLARPAALLETVNVPLANVAFVNGICAGGV